MRCSFCRGYLRFLGQLGSMMHFRCESCGMDSNQRDNSNDDVVQDWSGFGDDEEGWQEMSYEQFLEEQPDR